MILAPPSQHLDRIAVSIDGKPISRRDLWDAARAHAAHLRSEGLRPGARVAVWAQATPPSLAAFLGNALAGFVTVPLNPALGARELAHVLDDARPERILAADPATFQPKVDAAGHSAQVAAIQTSGPRDAETPQLSPDAPLLILYTSGTTGAPKGAVLSHENARSNLEALARAWEWTEADRLVHALPLFHVHGLVLGLFGSLRVGSSLHLLSRFSPEAIAAAFREDAPGGGATLLFAVPTMYHRLAEHLEAEPSARESMRRARLLVSGSAPLPRREHRRIASLVGHEIAERYGLTETLINCAVPASGDRRPGSVGPALPGIELRLLDEEGGLLGEGGGIGEVAVRGPNVFSGYLDRPEATAEVLDDEGFFRTGDLATRDPDGYLRIVGRKTSDLIKTGGYKVGAGEVEAALLEHPLVREAAVVALPDEDLGERIAAFVVASPGADLRAEALSDHVASLLAPHKRPREVHFLDALPRNAMGKVLKKELATTRSRQAS